MCVCMCVRVSIKVLLNSACPYLNQLEFRHNLNIALHREVIPYSGSEIPQINNR